MTYKLFENTLRQHAEAVPARLVQLLPLPNAADPDESDRRELFMPPALQSTLAQIHPKMACDYAANIRAFLLRFVMGEDVDNQDYMKNWRDDIFELRVQNQRRKDRLRIFGAFGRPDTFIALLRKPRSYFRWKHDPRWDEVIDATIVLWDEMFPGCRRVPAQPFSNCVTFNAYDCFQ